MSSVFIVIIASVAVVAFFVIGLSLTRMIKGHDIDSEIATNENMRSRGIKCAVEEARCSEKKESSLCAGDCTVCDTVAESRK